MLNIPHGRDDDKQRAYSIGNCLAMARKKRVRDLLAAISALSSFAFSSEATSCFCREYTFRTSLRNSC